MLGCVLTCRSRRWTFGPHTIGAGVGHGGDLGSVRPDPPSPQGVQNVEEVWTTFGPNLVPKAPEKVLAYGGGGRISFFYPLCVNM